MSNNAKARSRPARDDDASGDARGRCTRRRLSVIGGMAFATAALAILLTDAGGRTAQGVREAIRAIRPAETVVEVIPAELDFGQQRAGTNVEKTIVIRNTSDAPLRIDEIESSCGCAAGKKPEGSIAPGASVEVPVRLRITGKPGATLTRQLTVLFDDEEVRPVRIAVSATVEGGAVSAVAGEDPGSETSAVSTHDVASTRGRVSGSSNRLMARPRRVDFGTVQPGSFADAVVILQGHPEGALGDVDAVLRSTIGRVSIIDVNEREAGLEVVLRFHADGDEQGYSGGQVRLDVGDHFAIVESRAEVAREG